MLPKLREILRNTSRKNQSLQDILKTCSFCELVLTVEKHSKGIHNTKITLEIDKGELTPQGEERYIRRVHFYNRLLLADIIDPNYIAPEYNLDVIIADLNTRYSHDFTRDDLDIIDDYLVAKETSLGYYGDSGIRVIPEPSFEYATSKIYPIEEVIQLSTEFSFDEPSVKYNNYADGLEKLTATFDLDDVVISREVRYLVTTSDVEQLEASFSLDDVIVADVLKRQSMDPEALDCSFSLDDVIAANNLIRNTMPIEKIKCSFGLEDVIVEEK